MDASDVRRRWADRSGAYSPTYYAHHGPNETSETIADILERTVGRDAAVLEVGCSSGRHLACLHERGFRDLHGVEVNGEAFDVMAATYPELSRDGTFHRATIEAVVPTVPDDRFAAVFSVETLQHVHPDATDVFADLARITDDVLLTGEIEGGATEADAPDTEPEEADQGSGLSDSAVTFVDEGLPLYYRDWERVFTARGLVHVDAVPSSRSIVRTFRHPAD